MQVCLEGVHDFCMCSLVTGNFDTISWLGAMSIISLNSGCQNLKLAIEFHFIRMCHEVKFDRELSDLLLPAIPPPLERVCGCTA